MKKLTWYSLGTDLAELAIPPLKEFLERYQGDDKALEQDVVEMIYGLEQLLEENAIDDKRAMKGLELFGRRLPDLRD